MAPKGGAAGPLVGVQIAHMGQGAAGEGDGAAVMGAEHLDHVGIVELGGSQGINRGEHRWAIKRLKALHHGFDNGRIQQRLVPLHIDHQGLIESLSSRRRHQLIHHASQALTAGAAGLGSEQGAKPPALGSLLNDLAIGASHHRSHTPGLGTTLQHPAQHRLTADVGHHLAGQPGRFQACGNGHHDRRTGHGELVRSVSF